MLRISSFNLTSLEPSFDLYNFWNKIGVSILLLSMFKVQVYALIITFKAKIEKNGNWNPGWQRM